jgi:hypothetical protein
MVLQHMLRHSSSDACMLQQAQHLLNTAPAEDAAIVLRDVL